MRGFLISAEFWGVWSAGRPPTESDADRTNLQEDGARPGESRWEVQIYFWDSRDGPGMCGWWFGAAVGGDMVWSFRPGEAPTPPRTGWKVPFEGQVDASLVVNAAANGRPPGASGKRSQPSVGVLLEAAWVSGPRDPHLSPDLESVGGCIHPVVGTIVNGNFVRTGENHGKPVYKKTEQTKDGVDVLIYFWNDVQNPSFCGWWFGPQVGAEQVWAFNPGRMTTAPLSGWKVPYDGPVDQAFRISVDRKASAEEKRKRKEVEAKQHAEVNRAAKEIRAVLGKLKVVRVENLEELEGELKTVMEKELGNCDPKAKMQEECDKALEQAKKRVEQLKEAQAKAEPMMKELESLLKVAEVAMEALQKKITKSSLEEAEASTEACSKYIIEGGSVLTMGEPASATSSPSPSAPCAARAAGEEFLARLRLSVPLAAESRREWRWGALYCCLCLRRLTSAPEPQDLGLPVLILRHPKETPPKSSAAPLPLLSQDITVHEWAGDTPLPCADPTPGTWLVFPRKDAADAEEVDWGSVKGLVLVDSRWKHAKAMADHPVLAQLPAMKLGGGSSCFWRTATEKLAIPGLLSTAECVHQLLLLRAARLSLPNAGRLDDLLYFFALRLRLVLEEYGSDVARCCPWCTETSRRAAVHRGNDRQKAVQSRAPEAGGKKALRKARGQKKHQDALSKMATFDANKDDASGASGAVRRFLGALRLSMSPAVSSFRPSGGGSQRTRGGRVLAVPCAACAAVLGGPHGPDMPESGDPEQIREALEEAKRAGADEASVEEALAELKRKEAAQAEPEAALELCQKAEAFKKKGNERIKDNTKSSAREALELFTSGSLACRQSGLLRLARHWATGRETGGAVSECQALEQGFQACSGASLLGETWPQQLVACGAREGRYVFFAHHLLESRSWRLAAASLGGSLASGAGASLPGQEVLAAAVERRVSAEEWRQLQAEGPRSGVWAGAKCCASATGSERWGRRLGLGHGPVEVPLLAKAPAWYLWPAAWPARPPRTAFRMALPTAFYMAFHWGLYITRLHASSRHRVALCAIPKVGLTQFFFMMHRIYGLNKTLDDLSHAASRYDERKVHYSLHYDFWKDPRWKFVVFVRDPLERFLSAFLDKCLKLSTHCREDHRRGWENVTDRSGLPEKVRAFNFFVAQPIPTLGMLEDDHWILQAVYIEFGCSFWWQRLDFVGLLTADKAAVNFQVREMLHGVFGFSWRSAVQLADEFFPKRGFSTEVDADHSNIYREGLEVRCSDPVLNAQLYSNRAHVRLLLRQFVEAVDDCRKAIEQDPKNIKAYWRAARGSLQLDLCRNGMDFCEEGLQMAPGDADLKKLRDACAEKLAGQQQRRQAQAAAHRDFNADEAMAVQDKVTALNEQLARLKASLAGKQRQRMRMELTQKTIEETPPETKLYRGVGRCFLLGERPSMLDEMKSTLDGIDEELPKMQRASQELEKRKEDAEKELREMISAFRQQTAASDGFLDRKDLKKYAQSEFKFALPDACAEKIMTLLVPAGAKGVKKDDFQRVKVQVGIAREQKIDLERKKKREQRELEIEEMKEKMKGSIEEMTSKVGEVEELSKTMKAMAVETRNVQLARLMKEMKDALTFQLGEGAVIDVLDDVSRPGRVYVCLFTKAEECLDIRGQWKPYTLGQAQVTWADTIDTASSHFGPRLRSCWNPQHASISAVSLELPAAWAFRNLQGEKVCKCSAGTHWHDFAQLFGDVKEVTLVRLGDVAHLVIDFTSNRGAWGVYKALTGRALHNPMAARMKPEFAFALVRAAYGVYSALLTRAVRGGSSARQSWPSLARPLKTPEDRLAGPVFELCPLKWGVAPSQERLQIAHWGPSLLGIGRERSRHLCIGQEGLGISNLHAELKLMSPVSGDDFHEKRLFVRDLSKNGSFVNEQRVPKGNWVELRDKDVLRLAELPQYVVHRFEHFDPAQMAAALGAPGKGPEEEPELDMPACPFFLDAAKVPGQPWAEVPRLPPEDAPTRGPGSAVQAASDRLRWASDGLAGRSWRANAAQQALKSPEVKSTELPGAPSGRIDRSYIFYNLGIIFGSNGEYVKAVKYYHLSLDQNKEICQAYNNIAVIYHDQAVRAEKKGALDKSTVLYDKAAEYWNQALRIAPTNYLEAQNWLLTTGRMSQEAQNKLGGIW
ncbi:unnamed protein product [Effrenium voratum]|nr:unnamed protein product [Effrenium voratum]